MSLENRRPTQSRLKEYEGTSFVLPPTRGATVVDAVLAEALALFGLADADLDMRTPPAVALGGGDHLVLALKDRSTLSAMRYELTAGRALAEREGFVTFDLIHAETAQLFPPQSVPARRRP